MTDAVTALHALAAEYTSEAKPEALPGFTVADASDWQNEAERDLQHVFEKCLPCGTFGVLAGPSGGSKTTLAAQMCASIATGRELVPGFRPNRRGRALLICAEDPAMVYFKKLRAMANVLPVSLAEIDKALRGGWLDLVCEQPAPLLEFGIGGGATVTPAFDALVALCTAKEYDFIVIDPLLSFAGLNDENSNTAMQLVAGLFVTLAKMTGAGIIVLHHANKSGEKAGDIGQTIARGASSLMCASRAGWAVRPWTERDAKDAGIPSAEAARYVELVETKNSYQALRGGRQLFRRAEAGLLVPASVEAVRGADILGAIVSELIEAPVKLTRWEIYKSQGKLALEFRKRVAARMGGEIPGWRVLQDALTAGISGGELVETAHATNPQKLYVEAVA